MLRDRLIELIAAACHQQNLAWCVAHDDHSQADWSATPDNIRASAVDGVRNALAGASPAEIHANWLAFKVADGWRYGEVKDLEAKTHPCMVPYADLPAVQKQKDHLFIAMVQELGRVCGLVAP